ncbi:GNAT family N-acetyltransferase [Priestia taiwanensis]|uniref:Acetyltransferase n=1 Tax=Priestia taiwanensis TaxID=1347902 RepID=A0A917ERY3_9BACI|nr:GNAT family N-acetyltransferase [Priestia taiwanensis]MBM7364751.1 RimJ/RimL family protein N-acetyltransferase [Priestia taiwanensis]GGE79327.1 acetyltransferase [Priestia taiwanensis]
MIRITNRNKALASQFITETSDKSFAAVAIGNSPGEMWVDDEKSPSSALVWSNGLACFQFMGKGSALFTEAFVQAEIIPFLQEKEISYFEFALDSEGWEDVVFHVLRDRKIEGDGQYVYKSDWTSPAKEIREITDFTFVEITAHLLENKEIRNREFMTNYLIQYWGSIEAFIEKGDGYIALTKENEVASIAIVTDVYETTHTIGVVTVEAYRQRGLSSSLTILLVNLLRTKKLHVWWDCMEENIASQKTAEKAGLVRSHSYRVYWFYF